MSTERMMLEVDDVSVRFGGLLALSEVSIGVPEGQVTALIGPNGAGKSTLLGVISGFIPPSAGRLTFRGGDITGMRPHEGVGIGLARTFQDLEVMQRLTVAENVLLGFPRQPAERLSRLFLAPRATRQAYREAVQNTVDLLDYVGLLDRADTLAADLSYGEQKLLVVARLLATGADLLMLDEPGAGLPDAHLHMLGQLLTKAVEDGKTILLVDHNMDLIMNYADQVTVLHHGQVISSGTPREVQSDERVIDVYFSRTHTEPDEPASAPAASLTNGGSDAP